MEELLRQINNFEYDKNRNGMLTEDLAHFLNDLRNLVVSLSYSLEEAYQDGKRDGYNEGYDEGKSDSISETIDVDELVSTLRKVEDDIFEVRTELERIL